jgi:predicted GNAT family N-acyltransferase
MPEARVRHLGALLVRFAVATAGERGGHTMVAQIQLPNVRFFEHLGWHADGPAGPYHGVMHQPMAIPLAAGL